MRLATNAAPALLLTALLAGLGCNEQVPTQPTARSAPLILASHSAVGGQLVPRPKRERLRSLAQSVPGFTGIFFDSTGVLTIAAARDTLDAVSMKTLRTWAKENSGIEEARPAKMRE